MGLRKLSSNKRGPGIHPATHLFDRYDGPMAIVAGCKLCKHIDRVPKGRVGEMGRGWGMREGNKQRGRMIQHIKSEHPEALAAQIAKGD